MRRTFATTAILCLLAASPAVPALAQDPLTVRYELGKRLRRFERTFANLAADAGPREAAVDAMQRAVAGFFSMNLAGVGKALDDGVATMAGGDHPRETRMLLALTLRPDARVVAPGATAGFTIAVDDGFADADPDADDGLHDAVAHTTAEFRVEWSLADATRTDSFALGGEVAPRLSCTVQDGADADFTLRARFELGSTSIEFPEQTLSRVRDAATRLARLDEVAEGEARVPALEHLTLQHHLRLLHAVVDGRTQETDVPAARLFAECEALANAIAAGKPYFGDAHPGETWLRVPVGSRSTTLRLFVPPLEDAAPRALVLALHGAGGSENLFFDGYGDGLLRKLCAEAGWILCAPRSFNPGDTAALLDLLGERYRFDRDRVFLIGHSMGAAAALGAAQRAPDRFAKVAVLGGGGGLSRPESFRELPLYIGTAKRDFGRSGALALRSGLRAAGIENFEFHDLQDAEHMLVVQVALPEVFAFFRR